MATGRQKGISHQHAHRQEPQEADRQEDQEMRHGRPLLFHHQIQTLAGQGLAARGGHQHRLPGGHRQPLLAVEDDDVDEEDHARADDLRVVPVEHRPVHPVRREGRAEAIAGRVHPVLAHARRVEHIRMRLEDLAHGGAGPGFGLAGFERIHRHSVHGPVPRIGIPDQDRAHQAGMVMPVDPGEFQHQLVLGLQMPAPAEVAAEQGVPARPDDELVGRVVAAVPVDRAMHGGEDLALDRRRGRRAARPPRAPGRPAPPPCGYRRSRPGF